MRGFCTMVVPTSYANDIVSWHVLFNEDGGRIASTDTRVHDVAGGFRLANHLMPSALETRRHIIGWCRDMRNFAGTKEAQYKVRKSGLARPYAGFALDRINISGGKFLTVGVPIAIGKKDRPARAAKATDYHKQLDWAGKQYMLLYDREDNCGWLVDGLSALLHLTRARLAYRRSRGQTVEFEDDDITEAQSPLKYTGRAAAYALLTNPNNMGLKIYMKQETRVEEVSRKGKEKEEEIVEKITRTWERLPDLVGDIYQTLGILFDIQTDTKTLDGINFKIRTSPRRHLGGWDFHDVAADADPLWPKEATLQDWGWGWVDLVRGINAIVLFGNGFGDIIRPGQSISTSTASAAEGRTNMEGVLRQTADTYHDHGGDSPDLHTTSQSALPKMTTDRPMESPLCTRWATLPTKKELLATTTSVLDDIMNDVPQGDTRECFLQLHSGIYWHNPDRLFEECQCETQAANAVHKLASKSRGKNKRQEHTCDRVQVLLPTRFPSLYSTTLRSPPLPLPENGAAIFGHSVQFPLKWPVEAGSIPRVMLPTEPIEMAITAQEGELVHESNAVSSTSNSEASTASTSSPVPDSGSSQTGAETGTVAREMA
ncbi:serine/threonine protein kinase [Apiospora arundinis]